MLFGTIGVAYIIYAKNASRFLPAIVGVLLFGASSALPWFKYGTIWMLLICTPLTALPFIFREM